MKLTTNEQLNNIPENKNKKEINNQKQIFKEKIEKILNKNFEITEILEKFLKIKISGFLENNNFSFLKKYIDENGDFENEIFINKFKKYFSIHEEILFKILNQEIQEAEIKNKDQKEIQTIVKNFFTKYLHILFIFSEKIKLSDLEQYLKNDLTNLSLTYGSAKSDIILLDNFGKILEQKLTYIFPEENENFFIKENLFPYIYRRLYKEIETSGENSNKGTEISAKIEKEFSKAFEETFYIFETWIESGTNNDQKIKNLEIFIRKFFETIVFLKDENIAFVNFPTKNIGKDFVYYLQKYFLNFLEKSNSKYKKEFITFLENISNLKEKNGKQDEEKIIKQEKENKENLIKILKKKQQENAGAKVPKPIDDIENIDINKIDFKTWQITPEQQKYDEVFSKVIANNGKLKLNDFLEIGNKKLLDLFIDFYIAKRKIEHTENFRENIKNQLKNIKNLEGQGLKEFIENDVNNLNVLILWWRFILKIRTLKKENKEINLKNLQDLKEEEYGIIEKISKRLWNKNLLDSGKVIFSIDGKVRNTSNQTENIGLDDLVNGLKKGFIDLNQEKIILNNNEEKIIGRIQDLYIPIGLTEKKKSTIEEDISDIETHLRSGINFCYDILKGEEIIKNSLSHNYGEILIENNIIPKNYKNLDIKNKEKLQNLVEVLKFIKSRLPVLRKMMEIAQEDKKILEKNTELKRLLSRNQNSSFGPAKAFNRAFIKLIGEYGGNFNKLGDLIRARVVSKNLDESVDNIVKFIEACVNNLEITNISIVDYTGEPISIAKKDSGYRDMKLFLKLKSGNTVEVQFQIEEMYKIKDEGLNLEKNENNNVFEKMKNEGVLLTTEELKELLKIAKERNIKLPTKEILEKMLLPNSEKNISWEEFTNILTEKQISTDYSYHIVRQLDESSNIFKKLTRLERILADSAWSKIVLKYLENKNVEVN